jgi:AcrR family transcriptional regulator
MMFAMSTSVSPARRARPYHHGNLRPALLAEALRVLEQGDVATLSLRELARRLGVSHAAPYRHFADKDALLAAIAQQGFELLGDGLEDAAALHPDDPQHQLTETGWAYVQFALRHPQHFGVMFGRSTAFQASFPDLLAASRRAFGVLLRVIENGQLAGRFVPGIAHELALAAWSQVHGLATLLRERQLPVDSESDSEALVRRCLNIQQAGIIR